MGTTGTPETKSTGPTVFTISSDDDPATQKEKFVTLLNNLRRQGSDEKTLQEARTQRVIEFTHLRQSAKLDDLVALFAEDGVIAVAEGLTSFFEEGPELHVGPDQIRRYLLQNPVPASQVSVGEPTVQNDGTIETTQFTETCEHITIRRLTFEFVAKGSLIRRVNIL